jgi:hypothetical protein
MHVIYIVIMRIMICILCYVYYIIQYAYNDLLRGVWSIVAIPASHFPAMNVLHAFASNDEWTDTTVTANTT